MFWAIAAWTSTEPLEADLAQRSTAALKDIVLDKSRIAVAGRDVTVDDRFMTDVVSPVPAPVTGATSPGISRAIYGMPMFATLNASDLDRTVSWYVDGLGFVVLFTMPPPPSPAMLVHLRRWQFQDILVRPADGPVTAGSTGTLNFAAVYDEIDDLAAQARAHGGGAVEGPVDTPWNTREVTTTDPDGNVVVFTAGRPPDRTDPEFTAAMKHPG